MLKQEKSQSGPDKSGSAEELFLATAIENYELRKLLAEATDIMTQAGTELEALELTIESRDLEIEELSTNLSEMIEKNDSAEFHLKGALERIERLLTISQKDQTKIADLQGSIESLSKRPLTIDVQNLEKQLKNANANYAYHLHAYNELKSQVQNMLDLQQQIMKNVGRA